MRGNIDYCPFRDDFGDIRVIPINPLEDPNFGIDPLSDTTHIQRNGMYFHKWLDEKYSTPDYINSLSISERVKEFFIFNRTT